MVTWIWVNIGCGNGLAPSHYLDQCWLLICVGLQNSPDSNFKWVPSFFLLMKIMLLKFLLHLPGVNVLIPKQSDGLVQYPGSPVQLTWLVQVMAWCCQTISHYLTQYYPGNKTPYDITSAQWIKRKYQWYGFMTNIFTLCFQSFRYRSIRVATPVVLVINGRKLGLDRQAPTVLSLNAMSEWRRGGATDLTHFPRGGVVGILKV